MCLNEWDGWADILNRADREGKRVSILVNGSFKPYVGRVIKVRASIVVLMNEYSKEYISLRDIKAIRVYD